MIAVTGTPRSGTSVGMLNAASAMGGIVSIVGEKFPHNGKREERKKLNPSGFWEDTSYVMRGFSYNVRTAEKFHSLKNEKDKVIKLIASGLVATDPQYIDKLIICLRDPAETVNSQKDIKGIKPKADPLRQIQDYILISRYMIENPSLPYFILDYSYYEDPVGIQEDLCRFLEKDTSETAFVKKNKPKPERPNSSLWEEAYKVYEDMKAGKFERVLAYAKRERTALSRKTRVIHCERYGIKSNAERCQECKTNKTVKSNFIKLAKHKKLDFKNLPCNWDKQK